MKAMQVVRGNLAADPVFFEERPNDEGTLIPARWSATVLESKRMRDQDGNFRDDPNGPQAVSINLYGNSASLLNRCGMHRGDPVIAVGEKVRTEAYMTRDGQPASKFSLMAANVSYDLLMLQRKREREQNNGAFEGVES